MFIIIYITHKNLTNAKKVCNHLLKKKLIACANYFSMESAYWWNGNIDNSDEIVSIVKTRTALWNAVKKEVKKIHPYKIPCIMRINVEANEDYEKWIRQETRKSLQTGE